MNREYIFPQMTIKAFSVEDVVTVSTDQPTTLPVEAKTTVNGKSAISYGATDISIFD